MGRGAYHDDLVKVDGEWKIRRRRVVNDYWCPTQQSRSTSLTPTSQRWFSSFIDTANDLARRSSG
jgi:hypothetical protein